MSTERAPKALFGVPGLDDILSGGLARNRLYLVEGAPGSGKTTLALQFLLEGASAGERGLYVTLSETEHELREAAASHGWTIPDAIEIFELVPPESLLDESQRQSLLYSSDLELGETTNRIFEAMERTNPRRVIIDSLSEIRLLAQSSLRYRRQILAMKHHFAQRDVTVLLLDDMTAEVQDKTVHSVAHGVIRLEELSPDYGAERRRVRILKYRGQTLSRRLSRLHHPDRRRAGFSAACSLGVSRAKKVIRPQHGRPRTRWVDGRRRRERFQHVGHRPRGDRKVASGVSIRICGDQARRARGHFCFRRGAGTAFFAVKGHRHRSGGDARQRQASTSCKWMPRRSHLASSPTTSASAVEKDNIRTVVIDSLNGYQNAMPQEQHLILHMHELLQYLNRVGAATFLTVAQHGLVGDMRSPVDVTYLADTVVLLRYFEAFGRVRRAISMLKKRTGSHENTIREFKIGRNGINVGPVLEKFQGVLRGVPEYVGDSMPKLPEFGS